MMNKSSSGPPRRPLRSALFVPASKPRAIEKAAGLGADMLVLDLEDAVGPDEKAEARENVFRALDLWAGSGAVRTVRINALDTQWGAADLRAAVRADAILLPKVEEKRHIQDARAALNAHAAHAALWAMIETPLGVMNLPEIASASVYGLSGLMAGVNDLSKELRCSLEAGREAILAHLAAIICASRAHDLRVLDGVYNRFQDVEGFREETAQGKRLGFDGKSLIHPSQVELANIAFGPSPEEMDRARKVVEAFADPNNAGKGVIAVEGDMVERLHLDAARALLAAAGGNDA